MPGFFLFLSCGSSEAPVSATSDRDSPQDSAPADNNRLPVSDSVQQALRERFRSWQKTSIAEGRFLAAPSKKSTLPVFPDSSRIGWSYADLNGDGNTDQLVTFRTQGAEPAASDTLKTQVRVLFLSSGNQYEVLVSYSGDTLTVPGYDTGGIYWYDSIGVNKLYTTRYSFSNNDPACCPGSIVPVTFAYDTRKVIYRGANKAKKQTE